MPSPLISGTAHAQFSEGLHFSAFHFVNSSEGESGNGWESESEAIDDDSLYLPTPDRPVEVNYIDLPNKLCFLALPQVGKFLDMINQGRGCKTPGCNGKLF